MFILDQSLGPLGPSEKKVRELAAPAKVPKRALPVSVLESDWAMVVSLGSLRPMVMGTMRPRPSRQVRQNRSEDHVSSFRFKFELQSFCCLRSHLAGQVGASHGAPGRP